MGKFSDWLKETGEWLALRKVKKARKRQVLGMLVGVMVSGILLISLQQPGNDDWLNHGPLTPGHEELDCGSCHRQAEGSLRQQLQAKVKFQAGQRLTDADFGALAVDNAACQSCHDRPDDHHPVFRFAEPRFAELRKTLDATQCSSCHTEHTATVASVPETSFCLNCHEDLQIKEDPLEIPHANLIARGMGESCMQCHDFHGNHKRLVQTSLNDTLPVAAILAYLKKGIDPYGEEKLAKAKNRSDENE